MEKMNTVNWALYSLGLEEYTHVVVQERSAKTRIPCPLGGGCVSSVIKRFGHRVIDSAYITDGVLRIIVKEENI